MNISHIALRTDNIELLKDFYCRWFRGCLKTNVKAGVHSIEVDFGMN